MQYHHVDYHALYAFCVKVFQGYGFTEKQSNQITDVLLAADLSGIESHGIQRLIRYHKEITGGLVKLDAKPEIVFETPLSAVIEGNDAMGQTLGVQAMELAIQKAKQSGFGMVTVRNSNHYGIAGYYTKMAAEQGLIGLCMTNTEAIMVPTLANRPCWVQTPSLLQCRHSRRSSLLMQQLQWYPEENWRSMSSEETDFRWDGQWTRKGMTAMMLTVC